MAGGPVSGPNALAAISEAMAELEGEGILPDGIAADPSIGVALRSAYLEAASLPGTAPANEVFGVPVRQTVPWPSSGPDCLVGGWQFVLIGIREDLTFTVSREGTLVDDEGNIAVSAFQDDMVLARIYARFGCAIAKPLSADGSAPATPIVGASWSGASGATAPVAASASKARKAS